MSNKDYPTHKIKPDSKKLEFRIEEITFNNHYNVNLPHAHDYFELFLFKTGGGEHTIDFAKNEIHPNSVHLVLPGQIHQIGREGSCTGLVMMFSRDYLNSNPSLVETISNFPFIRPQENPYVKDTNHVDFDFFFDTVAKVLNENEANGFNSKPIIQSYLNILLLKTQELFSDQKIQLSSTTQAFLSILDSYCTNNTKSEEICQNLNITYNTLNSLLIKELGKSVKQLIKETLLTNIKKALLLSNDSIKTIGYNFDFSDPSNFNKYFKRETGRTPLDFRKEKS